MRKCFVILLAVCLVFITGISMAGKYPDSIGDLPVTGGRYLFVGSTMPSSSDSNPADASSHRYEFAFDTINTAIDAAKARSTTSGSEYPGDIIVVMPGHTEDIDAATDLVPDVAGLTIMGLGEGENRPRIDFTGTSGSILISGEGTVIKNMIFENQIDNVAEQIDVGADYVIIEDCTFRDKAGTSGLIFVMLDGANTADFCTFKNCDFRTITGNENGDVAIEIDDVQDGLQIIGCKFYGDYDEAPLESDVAFTNAFIYDIYAENTVADGYAIEFTGAATGFMDKIVVYTDDMATSIDAGSLKMGNEVWFSGGADRVPQKYISTGTVIGPTTISLTLSVSGGDTASIIDESLCGYPNDYFNYGWVAHFMDSDGTGATVDISDFAAATGDLTVGTLPGTPAAGDRVLLIYDPTRAIASDTSDAVDMTNEIPDNSPLANIISSDGDTSGYDRRYDSLEAISDAVSTLVGSEGLPYFLVTADSGDTTSIIDATYGTYGNDYFNVGWVATCIYNANSVGNAPEGQTRDISDFATSTGDFTVGTAFGAAVEANDVFLVYYDHLKAQAASTDLTAYFPDSSAMSFILDDGGDTSGYDSSKHSFKAIGDDTDTLITYTDHIADAALPTVCTANSLAAFIASGGTGLGTELADSKSIVDAIGTNGTTVADTATGIAGMIGVNDADNAMDTSTVVSNQDGSVYERLEQIMRMQPQVAETTAVAIGTSTANIFTIAGGYVEVLGLYAFVTTACDATGTNFKLTWDPAQGNDTDLCANLAIANTAQYSYIYLTGDVSDAAVIAVPATDVPKTFQESTNGETMILGPGTIDMTLSADPSGVFVFYLYYRIIEPGATVTAYSS